MHEKEAPLPEEKKEGLRLNIMEGGLTAFLQSLQGRQRSGGDGWKRSWRKRAGLGGRGYTKPMKKRDKAKIRWKMAKASRRINRKRQ